MVLCSVFHEISQTNCPSDIQFRIGNWFGEIQVKEFDEVKSMEQTTLQCSTWNYQRFVSVCVCVSIINQIAEPWNYTCQFFRRLKRNRIVHLSQIRALISRHDSSIFIQRINIVFQTMMRWIGQRARVFAKSDSYVPMLMFMLIVVTLQKDQWTERQIVFTN